MACAPVHRTVIKIHIPQFRRELLISRQSHADCHPTKLDGREIRQNAYMNTMAAIIVFALSTLPSIIEGGQFPDFYSFSDIDEDWPKG